MKCSFNEYAELHFLNSMMLYTLKFHKNSTGQFSDLLFLANLSEHSGKVPPRSSQLFQTSRYRQFLHKAFMVVARQRQGIRIKK